MQTLHLRFRALRAISLRRGLSRWRTPSDATRAGMGGAFALPCLGSARSTAKRSPLVGHSIHWTECLSSSPFPGSCLTPPEPTCAVGWRPASRHPDGIPRPVAGAGLPEVPRLRAARNGASAHCDSRALVRPCRVCRWQTARGPVSHPAPHEAGEGMPDHRQARASTAPWAASFGLSFPLRPQPYGGRVSGEKTVARSPDGSGTSCPGAPGFRPTGRMNHCFPWEETDGSPSPCASTPALVTGQEPGGTGVPGAALRCAWAFRRRLSFVAG